jgi:hypothetical protein
MRFGGGTQGPLWAVFLPHWPWWAPGGGSHQVGWSGEARGPLARGGATGGAALAFSPGWDAGPVCFFLGGGGVGSGWIEPAGSARLGPAKIRPNTPSRRRATAPRILSKMEAKWPFDSARAASLRNA